MSDQDINNLAHDMDGDDVFQPLVLRYLDGLTTAEENAGLNATLASAPEARACFVVISRQHGQLRELMLPRAAAAAWERRIRSASAFRRSAERARVFHRSVWVAAAAAVLIVAGIFFFQSRPGPVQPLAVVTQASGDGAIRRGEQSLPLSAGQPVHAGDVVVARADGRVTMAYPGESSWVELASGSAIRLDPSRPGKRIALLSGKLDASIVPQPAAAPMLITTPHASAQILGTRFRMIVNPSDTRIRVSDGRIQFDQPARGLSVVVSSNQYAIASAEGRGQPPSHSGNLIAGRCIEWETLFSENFGDDNSDALFVPDDTKIQGGVTSTNFITPQPGSRPVAVFLESLDKELSVAGGLVNRQGVFWVTEKRGNKISHYALLNATSRPKGLHALVRPCAFPDLDSFVLEYDMQSMLSVGSSAYSSLLFAASRDITLFRHPRRDAMATERAKAGRFQHSRFEVVACRDADNQKYYDIREYRDGTLVLHHYVYAEEHRLLVTCMQGCVKVDNLTVRRLEPFE